MQNINVFVYVVKAADSFSKELNYKLRYVNVKWVGKGEDTDMQRCTFCGVSTSCQ